MSQSRTLAPYDAGPAAGAAAVDRIESSADETTPIVRKKRSSAADSGGAGSSATATGRPPSLAESSHRRHKSTRASEGQDEGKEKQGWWKGVLDKYGAMELDNKGSVARDHLALERTFLAWLRTSLAFASIGIAITQLFRLNTTLAQRPDMPDSPEQDGTVQLRHLGKPLGATFLGVAIVMLFIGWRRYFESQYWLAKGKFPASRGSVFLVTIVAGILIIVSLVIVISVKRFDEPA